MTRLPVADGVAYEVRAGGTGPALLLVHGFTGRGSSWAPHLPAFRRHRRTIVVDLLGHGRSDAPADPVRHAVERQAADLAALLDRLAARPADVLGYSLGARIALRMAIDAPGAVRRLVLESPSAGIADPAARAERRRSDERWVRLLDVGDVGAFADAWEAQEIFAGRRRLRPSARARLRAAQLRNAPTALAVSLRGAGQGAMEPLHRHLGRIRVPTLILAGALDARGGERAATVAAGIPGARLEVLAGAGHSPHLETPGAFRRLVEAFLASSDPPAPPTGPDPAIATPIPRPATVM